MVDFQISRFVECKISKFQKFMVLCSLNILKFKNLGILKSRNPEYGKLEIWKPDRKHKSRRSINYSSSDIREQDFRKSDVGTGNKYKDH